jgi:ubiquinone/menaquinone biosynthesis C-methylase UbiE
MSQLVFDEEAARRIESIYTLGDAVRRRRIVREALGASPGERILDVGCGPGYYCLELLEDVGPSGSILGIDSSASMLVLAARRCAGHENVQLLEAQAVSLPVEDGSFDAALSVQVQEYVADISTSLAELHRALRPGGRVLVWDIDWATLSLHSEDRSLTERVLHAWDEHLAHPSLPRTLGPLLRAVGFDGVRMTAHPLATLGWDLESYGVAVVPFIGDFVIGRDGITEEEAKGWVTAQRELGEHGDFYFACTQLCFMAQKPV